MSTQTQNFLSRACGFLSGIKAEQRMFRQQRSETNHYLSPAKSQVICIASGKGGTGKTMVACNLAVVLAGQGLKVTLLDADLGLANAHLLLGVEPKYDLSHLMRDEKSLDEIMVNGPNGVRLVPGGSGNIELAIISDEDLRSLAGQLIGLEDFSDIILVDLSSGIHPQIIRFLNVAHDIILVTNFEATAQADVLATIGMLAETVGQATVHLVINRVRDREQAVTAFQQLWSRTNRTWRGRIKLFFSGWLPQNWYVQSSIILGKPVVLKHPQSLPTRCLQTMGARIYKHHLVWRSRQVGNWGRPSAFARLSRINGGPDS